MKFRRTLSLALALLMCAALLCGCGSAAPSEPAEQEASAAPESAAPSVTDSELESTPEAAAEVTPEPVAEPDTPQARAAALGLPAPPDVDITSWEFTLANSYNSICEYRPPNGVAFGGVIDARIQEPLFRFVEDATVNGGPFYPVELYLCYEELLDRYVSKVTELGGGSAAAEVFCGPGTNDHQTGLAFDLSAGFYYSDRDTDMSDSDAYKWMLEHCHEYGFILRFPEGKEEYFGTPCSRLHFRYVGEEAAAYIMDNNLCLEEFLLLYDENAVDIPTE